MRPDEDVRPPGRPRRRSPRRRRPRRDDDRRRRRLAGACATGCSVASTRSSPPARRIARARSARTSRCTPGRRGSSGTSGSTPAPARWSPPTDGSSPPAAGPRCRTSPGLALGPRVHTSDTIMHLDELPRSVVIFGGGFIAAEFAHVFDAFGCEVTQVIRGDRLLRTPRRRHLRGVHGGGPTALDAAQRHRSRRRSAPSTPSVEVDVGGRARRRRRRARGDGPGPQQRPPRRRCDRGSTSTGRPGW